MLNWKKCLVLTAACSVVKSCLTLCKPMDCSTPGFPVLHHPEVCSNSCPLTWVCHPTISSSVALPLLLPSIFPSIRVFSNESALHIRLPKYWSFSFSISPSNEYSGLISFKINWCDLAVQGTLKSLLQHHTSKASVLRRSSFFMIQLSHPYMTNGKTKGQPLLAKTEVGEGQREDPSLSTRRGNSGHGNRGMPAPNTAARTWIQTSLLTSRAWSYLSCLSLSICQMGIIIPIL